MQQENVLFKRFGVNSDEELLDFIKNNPDDPRSKEMKEMMEMFFGKDFFEYLDIEVEDDVQGTPYVPGEAYDWEKAMEEELMKKKDEDDESL